MATAKRKPLARDKSGAIVIIPFADIQHLIPNYVFNEFGQLTGHYVTAKDIVCVSENGRIKIWLNNEAMDANDPERLICDYDSNMLHGLK
ncbi:MAG TPA: hypothetical protein VFC63_26020 [Blastocatellia bacterium]|nr:hypothetical protein [Blastocatellia bacterium]